MTTFTWTPDFGASLTRKPLVKKVSFGDGYEQRVSFGINTNPQSWDLKFENRDSAETSAIDAFLTARGAKEMFDWTPPFSSTPIKVVCDEWSVTVIKNNLGTVSCKFRQVFEG